MSAQGFRGTVSKRTLFILAPSLRSLGHVGTIPRQSFASASSRRRGARLVGSGDLGAAPAPEGCACEGRRRVLTLVRSGRCGIGALAASAGLAGVAFGRCVRASGRRQCTLVGCRDASQGAPQGHGLDGHGLAAAIRSGLRKRVVASPARSLPGLGRRTDQTCCLDSRFTAAVTPMDALRSGCDPRRVNARERSIPDEVRGSLSLGAQLVGGIHSARPDRLVLRPCCRPCPRRTARCSRSRSPFCQSARS